MNSSTFLGIRRLQAKDLPEFVEHHLRLDENARRYRFGYALKDEVLRAHLENIDFKKVQLWGLFFGGRIVGSAMLAPLGKKSCEAAFTLESEWRGFGWGKQLLEVVLQSAYLREHPKDVVLIHMYENVPMKRMTRLLPGKTENLGPDVQKTVAIEEWGRTHFLMDTLMPTAEA